MSGVVVFHLHQLPGVWTEVWWHSLTLPEIPVAFPQPGIQIQKTSRNQTSDSMGEKLQGCLCLSKEGGTHRATRCGMRTLAVPELLRQAVRLLREVYQLWLHQFGCTSKCQRGSFPVSPGQYKELTGKDGKKSTSHTRLEKGNKIEQLRLSPSSISGES